MFVFLIAKCLARENLLHHLLTPIIKNESCTTPHKTTKFDKTVTNKRLKTVCVGRGLANIYPYYKSSI